MSKQTSPKPDKKLPGKDQGLTFWQCFAKDRLYTRQMPGVKPYLFIIPFFLAYLVLDFTLRYTYRDMGMVGVKYLPAALFTLGWALIFAGLVFALTKFPRWFVRCVPLVTFVVIAVTHSGFMSMFSRFFSFSVLTFGGTGSFFKSDYIHIDWHVVVGATVTVLLMMTSGRLLHVIPPKATKKTVFSGLGAFALGVVVVLVTSFHYFPAVDTVIWANSDDDAAASVYQNFTDTTNSLMVCGLYQYSVRDLWLQVMPAGSMSDEEEAQVDDYVAEYEEAETDNDYTGLFAGKNLIMVQLEATDTWMLENYMPTLAQLKSEGISFVNHYTPAYITAGTFNTEFMTNTSLMPATGGIPTSVYVRDDFACSLANLFNAAGYTSRSFHGSEGDVYDRGTIHPNLGYESYNSGSDMGMENYMMDRYLINGFDQMVEGDPFFSFVITYSGHGPYGDDSAIYQAHAEEAQAAAQRTDGNYVYAVAGAMETDLFVSELMDKLEESGHLEDTVLVFYADHYNYYMLDDNLNMEIKGVDNMNLLTHTDFFIWSADITPTQVEKVTSSLDVLPTVANLFGLDTTGAFFLGHDGLGDEGGYVFFADGSWYDGETYWDSSTSDGDAQRSAAISRLTTLSNRVLAGNYYSQK
jgi:phosphoglycerol transferase MdoB-like AlkP superfamily enzyme